MSDDEVYSYAKEIQAPVELVQQVKQLGRLPVVNFAAGGVVSNSNWFSGNFKVDLNPLRKKRKQC